MKKLMKSLMLFAAAAMALTSCQNEEMNEGVEKNDTFTVNFVTDAPESRTSVEISGGAANFAWGATGEEAFKFAQYAEGAEALTLGTDVQFTNNAGKGEISANFTGDAETVYNFTAVYPESAWVENSNTDFSNAKVFVKDTQALVPGNFDPNADLLVSKVITGTPNEVSTVAQQLQFTRLVSIAEMNLKLLQVSEGEKIIGVKFGVSEGTIAGRTKVDLASGEVVKYGYDDYKYNTITLTNTDGIDANNKSVKVYFTCIPTTIAAGATYTITVTTDKAIYTKSSTLPKDLTFEVGKVKAFGVDMEDAAVESSKSLAGDYIIVAKRTSGNFFYMTPDLGTASTKRFQAVDTGAATTDAIEMNEEYKWTIEESGNAYVIGAGGQYITYTSGNSANLDDTTGKAMTIEKASDADYYTITLVDDATRKLGLNNTTGNNYFAFYTGTQMHNLYLIPFAEDGREAQTLSFGETTEFTVTEGETFIAPELTGAQNTVTYTSSNTTVATVDEDGVVEILGVGTTIITASAEGNDQYKPATASYTLTVQSATPDVIEAITIAEFLEKAVDLNIYYELTGKIKSIANATYGNITIEDETASVYVYGFTKDKLVNTSNDQSFGSLNLKEGDVVTLHAIRNEYNGGIQAGGTNGSPSNSYPAYYISHYGITAAASATSVDAAGGVITIEVNNVGTGALPEAITATISEGSEFVSMNFANNTATVTFAKNEDVARSATITFSCGLASQPVVISQETGVIGAQTTFTLEGKNVTNSGSYTTSEKSFTATDGSVWKILGYYKNTTDILQHGAKNKNYILTPECANGIKTITLTCSGNYYVALWDPATDTLIPNMVQKNSTTGTAGNGTLTFNLPDGYKQVKIISTRTAAGTGITSSNAATYIKKIVVNSK